jgi:hypothetical protein
VTTRLDHQLRRAFFLQDRQLYLILSMTVILIAWSMIPTVPNPPVSLISGYGGCLIILFNDDNDETELGKTIEQQNCVFGNSHS